MTTISNESMNIFAMSETFHNSENAVTFLRTHGLLRKEQLCCGQASSQVKAKTSDGYEFRCKVCRKTYGARLGSIFQNSKLRINVLLCALYFFAMKVPICTLNLMCAEAVSRQSLCQWYSFLREICSHKLLDMNIRLGGIGHIVQMDECCIGCKRKYNRGAFRGMHCWVFGMICLNSNQCVLQIVRRRNRMTLQPIIKRYVPLGTTIYTDEAKVYSNLTQLGYDHHSVCHKRNYVSPTGVHTNNIESFWSSLKTHLRTMRGVNKINLPVHLNEYWYRWQVKHKGNFFKVLVSDISDCYAL